MKELFFDKVYENQKSVFGINPTRMIIDFLNDSEETPYVINVLDLGCGEGRDTIPLLKRGYFVTAIDQSEVGINKLLTNSELTMDDKKRLTTIVGDVNKIRFGKNQYDLVVSVTLLDHLNEKSVKKMIKEIISAIKPSGFLFIEVYSDRDPTITKQGPISEFSSQIHHFFLSNELIQSCLPYFRILRYFDRLEWDFDHGTPHKHGFVSLLAQKNSEQLTLLGGEK